METNVTISLPTTNLSPFHTCCSHRHLIKVFTFSRAILPHSFATVLKSLSLSLYPADSSTLYSQSSIAEEMDLVAAPPPPPQQQPHAAGNPPPPPSSSHHRHTMSQDSLAAAAAAASAGLFPPTHSRLPPDGHEFPPDYTDFKVRERERVWQNIRSNFVHMCYGGKSNIVLYYLKL